MINKFRKQIITIFRKYSLPRWLVLTIDSAVVYATFLFAYLLRFNLVIPEVRIDTALSQAWIVLGVYLIFMLIFKSYSGLIRHTTIKDAFTLFLTTTLSLIVLLGLSLSGRTFELPEVFNIPLSILMIHYGIVNVFMFFFRVFIKMFYEFASASTRERKNVIIYGAGEMGIIVKRIIESDARSGYRIVALLDDNWRIQGKKVDGVRVYSQAILSQDFISKENVKVFIFAINNLSPARKKEILEKVIPFGIEILETPSFDTWINGRFQIKQLRKVKFEDLLGREPIELNMDNIAKSLKDKTVLVTGAAGSIGSEIVRQLTRYQCKMLVLVDNAETPSFFLEEELREHFGISNFSMIIGDVTQKEKMEHIFRTYNPGIVFHAAAYKHVPVMEENPHEAFRVNVGGTKVISELAIKYGAEKFVLISSDKAVNPANVMGATKKICELFVQAKSNRQEMKTQFVTTRFGNVLGSNGSVIPVFRKQIEEGGPVTVTDPRITRFFMTIPEACQLVLEAGFMGKGGEIFVFDIGVPVRILDLANNLIRLSGLEPGEDIMIKFTGLRPGEKLYEELFSHNEPLLPTHHPKINIAKTNGNNSDSVIRDVDDLLDNLYSLTAKEVVRRMQDIVPEYRART